MEHQQFETFHNVSHMPLRVYNRVVMAYNIKDDFGNVAFENYVGKFTSHEKAQMVCMMQYIREKGTEAAKAFALKEFVPNDQVN